MGKQRDKASDKSSKVVIELLVYLAEINFSTCMFSLSFYSLRMANCLGKDLPFFKEPL